VEHKVWIKANSKELSSYEAIAINDTWCCDCEKPLPLRIIKRSELENFPVKKSY